MLEELHEKLIVLVLGFFSAFVRIC